MSTLNGGGWIKPYKRVAIYERDGWRCCYCGRGPKEWRSSKQSRVTLSLDHILPRHHGGDNSAKNLVTACFSCNSSRKDKAIEEYATGGSLEQIAYQIEQPLDYDGARAIIASLNGSPVENER